MNKFTIKLILLIAASIFLPLKGDLGAAFAQVASTTSSYSRFGLGLLSDQSQGFNRAMGGVGQGVRLGNRVNTTNPASYSAIDSLSIIMDVGMKASFGQMTQGTKNVSVKNASLEYFHMGMHIAKNLGLAIGFMPYTSIGYDYTESNVFIGYDPNTGLPLTHSDTRKGSGGLNQAYLGLGWKVFRNLSIGANVSLLWGKYNHSVVPEYEEGGYATSTHISSSRSYSASLKTYKIDLGAQYPVRLTPQDWLTLGATFGIGHKIPQELEVTTGSSSDTIPSPFDLPFSFGFGGAWQHKNTLLVAADVRHERWSSCRMPVETSSGYVSTTGSLRNMTKIAVGTQWTPAPFEKKYWKRIQYRAGVSYMTPYFDVDERKGPMEFSLSIGAGLPITNRINNRSVVNFGLQWLRRSSHSVGVREDYLLINLGMTFNERWFMKYKIE